jgi:hypothetical protein
VEFSAFPRVIGTVALGVIIGLLGVILAKYHIAGLRDG